jgi:glycosyltransferase involved in cell wall biosynthesis
VIEAMHQGGAESLIAEHVRHAGRGVESLVCALNRGGPALDLAAAYGARTFVLDKRQSHPLMGRLAAIGRLAALIRSERVDVVNGHNPVGALYASAAGRLGGARAVVRTEHSIHYPGRHSVFYPALENLSTLLADRVICVCDAARVSHATRLGWAASRFVTILNGTSGAAPTRTREQVRASFSLLENDRLALHVGSLTPQKAQHVLIEAFMTVARRSSAARLFVVGDGPLKPILEQRVADAGFRDRVRFLGPRLDIAELMVAADAYVLSSVREGLSVTLIEAMRAGLPCVATRVGGNPEAVADGETGIIVPPGDPESLSRALLTVLDDRVLAGRMARAGRDRWRRLFTGERMVRDTEALYASLLARRSPATATRSAPGAKLPELEGESR